MRTDAERAAFKRGEWERIADLHPGVPELLYALQRRLDAIRDHRPRHPIVPLDGHCAICGEKVYESNDYRGGRYRHEDSPASKKVGP